MRLGTFPKNAAIYMVGGIVAAGGNVILAPVYLRTMQPDEFGVWSRFLLFFQIAQSVMGWGLMASVTRLLTDGNDSSDSSGITKSAIKLATVLNGTLLILFSSTWLFSIFTFNVKPSSDGFLIMAAMTCASLLVYPLILMGKYISIGGALQHRTLSLIGFGFQAVTLLAAFLIFKITSTVAILSMVVAMALYATLALFLLFRKTTEHDNIYSMRPLVALGLPVMMYTLAGQMSDLTIRYLLSLQSTATEFGQFSGILLYTSVLAMVSSAINLAWIPILYRNAPHLYTSGIYRSFTELFISATSGVAVFMLLFAPEMIYIFSDGELTVPRQTILFLTVSAWLSSVVWTTLSNPLFEQKKTTTILVLTLVAAFISLPASAILIDHMEGEGAAMALALNSTILCILAFLMGRKITLGSCSPVVIALSLAVMVAASLVPTMDYFVRSDALQLVIGKIFLLLILVSIPLGYSIKSGVYSLKYINDLVTR